MIGCKTPENLAAGIAAGLQLYGMPLMMELNRGHDATGPLKKRSFRGYAAEGR